MELLVLDHTAVGAGKVGLGGCHGAEVFGLIPPLGITMILIGSDKRGVLVDVKCRFSKGAVGSVSESRNVDQAKAIGLKPFYRNRTKFMKPAQVSEDGFLKVSTGGGLGSISGSKSTKDEAESLDTRFNRFTSRCAGGSSHVIRMKVPRE